MHGGKFVIRDVETGSFYHGGEAMCCWTNWLTNAMFFNSKSQANQAATGLQERTEILEVVFDNLKIYVPYPPGTTFTIR
jgi:hypothetical protein